LGYDTDGLLTQAGALTLTRDPQHAIVTATTLDTITDTRSVNGFGEWDSYAASAGATPLVSMQYTRDAPWPNDTRRRRRRLHEHLHVRLRHLAAVSSM
jgi:hypothetical protein